MRQAWQKWIYEATAPLGPELSAIAAGYGVLIWGEVHITPDGEAYLAALDNEETEQ